MLLNDERPENRMPGQWRSHLVASSATWRLEWRVKGVLRTALSIAVLLALDWAAIQKSRSHGW